jgi:hypothetical protein
MRHTPLTLLFSGIVIVGLGGCKHFREPPPPKPEPTRISPRFSGLWKGAAGSKLTINAKGELRGTLVHNVADPAGLGRIRQEQLGIGAFIASRLQPGPDGECRLTLRVNETSIGDGPEERLKLTLKLLEGGKKLEVRAVSGQKKVTYHLHKC